MLTKRGKFVIAIIVCMLVGALFFALRFLYEPALLLLSITLLSAWILHLNQKSLFLMFFISSRVLSRGEPLTVEYMLSNKHYIPIFSAHVHIHLMKELGLDAIEIGHNTFNPYEIKAIKRHVVCEKRGFYTVGSLSVVLRDPLGFFECSKWIERPVSVTVYPRVDCATLKNEYHRSGGNQYLNKKRLMDEGAEIDQLRAYELGEDIRNIHWRVSARAQSLISKSLIDRAQMGVWIILEGNRALMDQLKEEDLEPVMDYVASLCYSAVQNGNGVKMTLVGTTILTTNCFDQESLKVFLEMATGFEFGGDATAERVIMSERFGTHEGIPKLIIGKPPHMGGLSGVVYEFPALG